MTVFDTRSAEWVLRARGLTREHAELNRLGLQIAEPAGVMPTLPSGPQFLTTAGESYFVEGLPVEIHCHSMGDVDFSEFADLDLPRLDAVAAVEGVACVPTVYLAHEMLDEFVEFMHRYAALRRSGRLPYIPAIALEGPLLASHGGTPASTVWPPSKAEWDKIARCGGLGLAYVVISPDGLTPDSGLYDELGPDHPDMTWIVRTLVENGVRPALGHYTKAEPERAAELTLEMVHTAWEAESPIMGIRVVTDHLFNDMPLTIKHAFRTRRARSERDATIASYDLASWNLADLPEQVGPVPATIMRLCYEGKVASCINFDGEHVDLAIAARAVEVIGQGNVILMTDRCDAARLGGQQLHHLGENSLWYQNGGVVAAGSQPLDLQLRNARDAGIDEHRLWDLVSFTPYAALGLDQDPWLGPQHTGSFVVVDPERPDERNAYARHAVVSTSALVEDEHSPAHRGEFVVVPATAKEPL